MSWPTWAWTALTVLVIAFVLWLACRTPRRVQIEMQERHVAAWEDACQLHPGLYEADLERERAKLARMRK